MFNHSSPKQQIKNIATMCRALKLSTIAPIFKSHLSFSEISPQRQRRQIIRNFCFKALYAEEIPGLAALHPE
jgi:hypothetical protein